MRYLACLDETARLGTRLGDGGALLCRLGTIVVRRGVDRQRDEIVILVGRGLAVRTSHDRSLPRLDSVRHRRRRDIAQGMRVRMRRHLDEY